jgi:Fic family protein
MKIPVPPPPVSDILRGISTRDGGPERLGALISAGLGPAPNGKYTHWDRFRHAPPRDDFTAEEQWLAVKLARAGLHRAIPLRDRAGRHFQFALPNLALELLHQIDRSAGGNIAGGAQVTDDAMRDTYLFKSIVEEAITSSQLEGASTTRKAAKAMLQDGRAPTNRSERMILNNYEAMLFVREARAEPLTPAMVMALHRIVTDGTLDEPDGAGRFRRADEEIVIDDETGVRLHTPPAAHELKSRLQAMCDFANGLRDDEFIPPPIRSILLHFWLAYDHPFVDGNGRTARALFYWSMARQGYWLCEFVSISRILKKAPGEYARSYLYTESDDNDATYFIVYHMRVLLRAIADLHTYLARKAKEMRQAEARFLQTTKDRTEFNVRQLALLRHAVANPSARYTVESHRRSHGVSYQTARTDLLALSGCGFLDQRKEGRAFTFLPSAQLRDQFGNN